MINNWKEKLTWLRKKKETKRIKKKEKRKKKEEKRELNMWPKQTKQNKKSRLNLWTLTGKIITTKIIKQIIDKEKWTMTRVDMN